VADRLGRPPITGLEQRQVAAGLAVADVDVGAEGVGQLSAGPRPLLGEQRGQLAGHLRPPGLVRVGSWGVGVERRRAAGREALEGRADGVWMATQVLADAGRGPPASGQENDLQPIADHRR
jgi:hypothetical protein